MSSSAFRNISFFLAASFIGLSAGAVSCLASPSVSLSPSSLTFAEQLVYPSAPPMTAPQTVTLTNTGTTALTITSVALGGSDPGDYILVNNCLSSIPASGTCTASVQFNPQSSGSRTASVQITDNATGSPQSVTLSGTGENATATYYVAPDGSDSNTGLSATPCGSGCGPFLTPNHAGHVAFNKGNIVYVRGGVYLNPYWESYSGNSLSAAMPVVLAAYPGERPIFTGNSGAFVEIQGGGTIIDGIDFENVDVYQPVVVEASNNIIQNCVFHLNEGEWIALDNGTTNTIIRQNIFDTNGYLFTDGEEDALPIAGAQGVLVENNFFTRCGHYCSDTLYREGTNNQNIIWKDNTIVQYWGGGLTAMGETPATQAILEGNRISHVGEGVHYSKDAWFSNGQGDILRNNVITNTAAWFSDSTIGLIAEILGQDTPVSNVHIYNNTIYNDGPSTFYMVERYDSSDSYEEDVTENYLVNNILYEAADQVSYFGRTECPDLTVWCAYMYSTPNYWTLSNFPHDNYTFNNDLSGTASSTAEYWPGGAGGNTAYTLSTLQTTYSTYFTGNIAQNPLFASAGDAENANFTLQSTSPAVGAGSHLTQTTASGTNTTTVTVTDPYYFTSGGGLMPGDMIVVGSNSPVRVTAVNYSTGALTVGSSISFSSSANVDLADFNGTAPDMGAFPYSSTTATISGISSSSVSPTSETIAATTSVAAACQVEYGPTTDYGRTSAVDASLATSHSITLTSALFAGQTYHYALICTNATYGRTVSSDETFTAAVTGPAISGVYISAVSISGSTASATISWTTSTSATSQVVYSGSGAVRAYLTATSIADTGGVTNHSVTLSGLTINSSYQFMVQSTDVSTGITNVSPQGVFITPSNATSGPVFSNITISQIVGPTAYKGPPSGSGYSSADFESNYSCCGYDNAESTFAWSSSESVTNFGLNFQTNVGAAGEGILSAQLAGQQTFTGTITSGSNIITGASPVTGLIIGQYVAYVGGTNGGGICNGSTITGIGTNTVTLSQGATWNESGGCGSIPSGSVTLTASFNYGVPVSGNPASTASPQITLYYMPPNSAMVFQIFGQDSGGNTTTSPWMYWLTPVEDLNETPSIPPQTYMTEKAASVTSSSATITWTLTSSSTCEVEYGTTSSYGSTASSGSGTSCSISLSSLTAGTTYHVAVIATNSAGLSFTGQDFTFTTTAASVTLTGKTCASVGSSSGTSATCTWSSAPSANETILCGADNNANSAMSMTDNASTANTYTGDGSRYAGTGIPAYYQFFTAALIANSPTTTTVSASTGNYLALACISYTGGSSSPTDGSAGTHSQTGGHSISASTTTSNANDVIAGYSQIGYPYTLSAPSGWTLLSPSGDTWYGLVYQVTSSSGSQTCTANTNVNSNGDMICGGFK